MAGLFTLSEAEHGREVALIGLREGRHLYERFPDLRGRNFELAFTSVANEIRAFKTRSGSNLGVDADALGFLFMGPLLYHRIIEWLTGETALGITDDQLIAQWAQLFAPDWVAPAPRSGLRVSRPPWRASWAPGRWSIGNRSDEGAPRPMVTRWIQR